MHAISDVKLDGNLNLCYYYVHIFYFMYVEVVMITVTATNFRKNLFEYLDKVADGEIVVIQRNNEEVARVVPLGTIDWRAKITEKLTVNVPPEELIEPVEGIWDNYL